MDRRIFVDMDGTLAEWIENESTDVLYEKGYYENLKPNQYLLQVINGLIDKGEDIYILSSFLNDSKYALEEKQRWLEKYLPNLPKGNQLFIKYGENKTTIIPNGIRQFDYLIDDYSKNLFDWKDAGGIAIKFLNGINNRSKQWQGLNIKEGENLLEELQFILEYPEKSQDEFNQKFIEYSQELKDAIKNYQNMVNRTDNDFLNAELKVNLAKDKYYAEKKRLQNLYDIDIIKSWEDSEKVGVNYKISFKDGRKLYEGYDFFSLENENISHDLLFDKVLGLDVKNRKDIVRISPELKDVIDRILLSDEYKYIRLYPEDLIDSWKIPEEELNNKIDKLRSELYELGIDKCVEFDFIDSYPNRLEYIDINPQIISHFEFSNYGKNIKTYNYTINGKDVVCELEFNPNLGGFAVSGYTIEKNQQLTKEELSIIQGKLFNEVNEIYNEMVKSNDEEIDIDMDIDITDNL